MFETVSVAQVIRYKRSARGPKQPSSRPDAIAKAKYESKLKLNGDSRAFASDIFPYGPLDRLAEFGITPLTAKVKRG